MNKIIKKLIFTSILLQSSICGAVITSAGLIKAGAEVIDGANDIYGAKQASENAVKKGDYKQLVPSGLTATSKVIESYGSTALATGTKIKKYNELSARAYKLLKKVYPDSKKSATVEKLLKSFSSKTGEIKKAEKLITKGKTLQKLGKRLGVAANAATLALQYEEYKNTNQDGLDVQDLVMTKNAVVAAVSSIPGVGSAVGLVDTGTDIAVDATNTVIDAKRDASMQVAEALQNLQNSYDNQLRRNIKKATIEKKRALTKTEINAIYTKNRSNMIKAVNSWKQQVKETNSWFDGDVGQKNYDLAMARATRLLDKEKHEIDLNILQNTSKNANELMLTLQEVKKAGNEVSDSLETLKKETISTERSFTALLEQVNRRAVVPVVEIQKEKIKPVKDIYQDKKTDTNIQKAEGLRKENRNLANAYEKVYLQIKQNPNDKNLQEQLASIDTKLRENAQAFIELRAKIQEDDPSYKAYVDGPNTIKKRVDVEPQTITVRQGKEPKLITEEMQQSIELSENKIENVEVNTETNPSENSSLNSKNDEILTKLSKIDKKLKDAIKSTRSQKYVLKRKEQALQNTQSRISGMQKYNYSDTSSLSTHYDSRKTRYLQKANEIRRRNQGKPFSKWSKSDQVAMGIAARNLGIASSSSITHKGAILNAFFKREGFSGLQKRYAKITISSHQQTRTTNYSYTDLESTIDALKREISTIKGSIATQEIIIRGLESQKNILMSSVEDSVQDYNNDVKLQVADNTLQGQQDVGSLWLGSITFNSEDRLAGGATKLRYWGGQFDQTVAQAVRYSGGGPVFNGENSYLVDNGKITSFAIGHGGNTATDNTKEFHIFDNEIDKASSFYDQNINTLKLERQLPNGETLSIRTTGHYSYSAWGEWGQTGGLYTDINGGTGIEQKAIHNNWQAGQRTQDLPKQGSATYIGIINGHYYVNSVGSDYGGSVHGTMSMTVDFANTSVVSGVLNIQKQNGATLATAHMDQMQINRSEGGFAGRLIGADIAVRNGPNDGSQNMIVGQFNGPHAEEVSGIWNVTNTNNELATGTFAGKR